MMLGGLALTKTGKNVPLFPNEGPFHLRARLANPWERRNQLTWNFAVAWTPPVPGVYTIRAAFEGPNSYYRSKAGTSFVVAEPGAAQAIATSTPNCHSATRNNFARKADTNQNANFAFGHSSVAVFVIIAAAVLVLERRK